MLVGTLVKVEFSECKGYGAEKVGSLGVVTKVEDEHLCKVEFGDGKWFYLDRELQAIAVLTEA